MLKKIIYGLIVSASLVLVSCGDEQSGISEMSSNMETEAATTNRWDEIKETIDIQVSEPEQSVNFQVGDGVRTDKFEFTVTNAYVIDDLGWNKKIPEGAVYVAVEFSYKNISKQPISSWSLPLVYLLDGNDAPYTQDADASWYFDSYSDSKIISDMNPGIISKDARIYEVAADVLNEGGMRVYVKADQEFCVDLNLSYGQANSNSSVQEVYSNWKSSDVENEYNVYPNGLSYGDWIFVTKCKKSITLRVYPSTKAEEICQVPLGSGLVFISKAENGFCQVEYQGITGYVLAEYLDAYEPQM